MGLVVQDDLEVGHNLHNCVCAARGGTDPFNWPFTQILHHPSFLFSPLFPSTFSPPFPLHFFLHLRIQATWRGIMNRVVCVDALGPVAGMKAQHKFVLERATQISLIVDMQHAMLAAERECNATALAAEPLCGTHNKHGDSAAAECVAPTLKCTTRLTQ